MSSAAAFTFAVVCEAPDDRRMTTALADRILCGEVDWIESESLELHRKWRGLEEEDSHLEWHWVSKLAKQLNIRAHGHFRDEPGTLDAAMARKALLLLTGARRRPDAVILSRDTDGREARRQGLSQARDASPWPFEVVLAVAHTKMECWVLAGFDPESAAEEAALAELKRELGFDPRVHAEGLTAAEPRALRNAKRILERLIARNRDREEACWISSDLETLRNRGSLSGLTDYLDEIRDRLVPLFKRPGPA
ncbi:MAG: hypothetical protein WAM82_16720 [Thermoanaerobaculia bacterium]